MLLSRGSLNKRRRGGGTAAAAKQRKRTCLGDREQRVCAHIRRLLVTKEERGLAPHILLAGCQLRQLRSEDGGHVFSKWLLCSSDTSALLLFFSVTGLACIKPLQGAMVSAIIGQLNNGRWEREEELYSSQQAAACAAASAVSAAAAAVTGRRSRGGALRPRPLRMTSSPQYAGSLPGVNSNLSGLKARGGLIDRSMFVPLCATS